MTSSKNPSVPKDLKLGNIPVSDFASTCVYSVLETQRLECLFKTSYRLWIGELCQWRERVCLGSQNPSFCCLHDHAGGREWFPAATRFGNETFKVSGVVESELPTQTTPFFFESRKGTLSTRAVLKQCHHYS